MATAQENLIRLIESRFIVEHCLLREKVELNEM